MQPWEKLQMIERLRPLVETLGWVIVEETYKCDRVFVTLSRDIPEKSSEPVSGSEE